MNTPLTATRKTASALAGCLAYALLMSGAEAQFLSLQELAARPEAVQELAAWQKFLTPEGRWQILEIRQTAADNAIELPPGKIKWAGLLPAAEPRSTKQAGYQMTGDIQAPVPAVEELSPLPAGGETVWTAPPGADVCPGMAWTGFGVEERVQPKPEESPLDWAIQPGKKPAGLYGASLWRLPVWPRAESWTLKLTLKGRGRLSAGLSADLGQGHSDPPSFSTFDLQETASTITLRVPEKWKQAASLKITLAAASAEAMQISLLNAVWLPSGQKPARPRPPELGVWDWSTAPDRWKSLLPLWQKAGLDVVQLALPREMPPPSQEAWKQIQQAGLQIIAVEGDPHMVLPEAREAVLNRHRQLGSRTGGMLSAVQYDVEPYLLPGFRLQPRRWYAQWGGLFEAIHQTATVPAEAVVPFWLIQQPEGPRLLEKLKKTTSRIVVMNYRSATFEAVSWGAAWLEWSALHQHPVALAVECGPVADVPVTTFRQAREGPLWVAPWKGHGTLAVLFDNPIQDPSQTGQVYALTAQSVVPGARTTLQGQNPARVREILAELNRLAAAMQLPERLRPRLLLHEPDAAVLEELSATKPW